jgi:lactoylglutathione lyase
MGGMIPVSPLAFEKASKHAQLVDHMIKRLLHTRYRVTDLEKTVAFYRDVLGLKETRRHTSGRGSQLVFFKAPASDEEIEICKFDESGPVVVGPDLTHLAFEVDDIEAFARESAKKGYPLSDGPHPNGKNGAIAFIDAPEGYEIELIQRSSDE